MCLNTKIHINEVVAAFLNNTNPLLIHGVLRWVAREAGPGWLSSRARGAIAAAPAGQSSRAESLVAREAGPNGIYTGLLKEGQYVFHTCYKPKH